MATSTIRGEAFGRLFAIIEKACLEGRSLSRFSLCAQYSEFQDGGAYLHAMIDTAREGIGHVSRQDVKRAMYLSSELNTALCGLSESVGGDAAKAAHALTLEERSAFHLGYAEAFAKYRGAEEK